MAAHQDDRASPTRRRRMDSSAAMPRSTADLLSETETPPAKRPRLKLNVRARQPNDSQGDTIAVSRPRREPNPSSRYSSSLETKESRPRRMKPPPRRSSPAPSSGLSSLSSAPPSTTRQSPFRNPSPSASARDEYGDFMSYYVLGGDEEETKEKAKPVAKSKSRQTANLKSKLEPLKLQNKTSPAVPSPEPHTKPKTKSRARGEQHPLHEQSQIHSPQVEKTPIHHVSSLQAPAIPGQLGFTPSAHHPGHQPYHVPPPHMQPGHLRPMQLPQPIIHFMDVQPDPIPTTPDTLPIVLRKLEGLSSALTSFGNALSVAPTPPGEVFKVPKKSKKKKKKASASISSNPLDGFLSLFGGDDDDEQSEANNVFDSFLFNGGLLDDPLTYGIQFIQNALKSWAQQRMTQQVTQQWNLQQAEQFQRQMQGQRRGPGRPRQYDTDQPIQPIIQMALVDTSEGAAIKAFQSVLDSGCLRVNCVLPAHLSRALGYLYIQIDHLINQGSQAAGPWRPMSYGAQIQAHRTKVERWKEAQIKHREEMARQQQLAQEQVMNQMGLRANQGTAVTTVQFQQQHAIDLERRRSMQHASQQPYNADQHLNPLQLHAQRPNRPNSYDTASGDVAPSPAPAGQGSQTQHTKGNKPGSTLMTDTTQPVQSAEHARGDIVLDEGRAAEVETDEAQNGVLNTISSKASRQTRATKLKRGPRKGTFLVSHSKGKVRKNKDNINVTNAPLPTGTNEA